MSDARSNAELNGVELEDGRTVSWAEAHPRPWWNDPAFWESARPDFES